MNGRIENTFKLLEESILSGQLDTSKQQKSKLVGGTVCKYWLENRCKKGENCEYLHENIPDKLPECPLGVTCNRGIECPFKHTPRQIKECQFYNSGYCKEGKACKLAHIKRELCLNYTLGFCPEGPMCKLFHLKSLVNPFQDNMNYLFKKA